MTLPWSTAILVSPEFGWSVRTIRMRDCTAESEYFLMRAGDMDLSNVTLRGKYSFQYIEDAVFDNCRFDTKDAFWHAKNVTVRDSVIKGEYLAWYSRGADTGSLPDYRNAAVLLLQGLKAGGLRNDRRRPLF